MTDSGRRSDRRRAIERRMESGPGTPRPGHGPAGGHRHGRVGILDSDARPSFVPPAPADSSVAPGQRNCLTLRNLVRWVTVCNGYPAGLNRRAGRHGGRRRPIALIIRERSDVAVAVGAGLHLAVGVIAGVGRDRRSAGAQLHHGGQRPVEQVVGDRRRAAVIIERLHQPIAVVDALRVEREQRGRMNGRFDDSVLIIVFELSRVAVGVG